MNEATTTSKKFDVFLCHNSEDKPAIRDFARKLEEHGIKPWLDEEQIRPGTSWQTALGEQIEHIKSAAVFVGESGFGPWQNQEIQALLSQFVNRKCPVIPVVLPTAEETPDLPWTLQNIHWVDFRADHPDPMGQLVWGITGEKPGGTPQETQPSASDIPVEVAELFPPQKKKVIEVRLPGNLDDFSDEEQKKLIQSLTSMMKIGDVKLTRAVAGSVRLYLELDPEDADKLHSAKQEGLLADLGIQDVRLYPALPEAPEDDQQQELMILLDRMKEYWIDGVLKNSLYHEVLISLGKHTMDEAVEPPSKHYVEFTGQRRFLDLEDRNISTVFDATGLLLILGEPGSGKTTTMLDLATNLIARAKGDPRERVPIALNLSSWKKLLSLDDWIAEELSAKYRVPREIGRRWLKKDYILPLLDGLDEVNLTDQPGCVVAINKYIDEYEPSGLVVCCRLMEYQWLPERLQLNGAICLELLGPGDVDEFLAGGGPQLAGLRQGMQADLVLQELAQTPLMLSIMSLVFEGKGGNALATQKAGTVKERRDQIFNLYIERMFQRKDQLKQPFQKSKVINWLSWLARGMQEHSQSVFMVEELQPNWLDTKGQLAAYGSMASLTIALIIGLLIAPIIDQIARQPIGMNNTLISGSIFGLLTFISILMCCWSNKPIINGFLGALTATIIASAFFEPTQEYGFGQNIPAVGGIPIGLICGVGIGSLKVIKPIETLRWQSKQFWREALRGSLVVVIYLLLTYPVVYYISGEKVTIYTMLIVMSSGLVLGFACGMISGYFKGLIPGVKDDKAVTNQGIRLSLMNAVRSFPLVGLFGGMIGGLGFGLLFSAISPKEGLTFGLVYAGICGLILGFVGCLYRGGSAFLKHYSLRFVLWVMGYTPINFIQFLDHSAKLILLKKVGGGYMFIHRMLLEHFAEMDK